MKSQAPFVAEMVEEDRAEWARRMQLELDSADEQGADPKKGVIVVLGKDGTVSQRRIGMPLWRMLLIELSPGKFDPQERRAAGVNRELGVK